MPSPCAVDDCSREATRRGWCEMHYRRWRRTGGVVRQEQGHGQFAHNWRGDEVGYAAAHNRVYAAKGKASEFWCEHCDDRASQWAYDNQDPDEKQHSNASRSRYSTKPEHYFPLCAQCHDWFDMAVLA